MSDNGVPPRSTIVPVTVNILPANDGPPVLAATYAATILESAPPGFLVYDLFAPDVDDPEHPHGNIQYRLLSGDSQNQFAVDLNTGRVLVGSTTGVVTKRR